MVSSASQRVKSQRQARLQAGWVEVRAWVPTKEDAEEVQKLAAELRAKALDITTIERLEGVKCMNKVFRQSVLDALSHQGSTVYATPSGAFLELLSELAKQGNLADMSAAFRVFVAAYPSNANYVATSVPPKLLNHYFIPSLGLNGAGHFLQWQQNHREWATVLTESLLNDKLQHTAENMLADIRAAT